MIYELESRVEMMLTGETEELVRNCFITHHESHRE
jgi:hypothetical protein